MRVDSRHSKTSPTLQQANPGRGCIPILRNVSGSSGINDGDPVTDLRL